MGGGGERRGKLGWITACGAITARLWGCCGSLPPSLPLGRALYRTVSSAARAGTDAFLARTAPAGKAFDQLDPDFNSPLFLGVLAAGALATAVLTRMAARKELEAAWR
jgi:hypothetical protein